MVAYSFITAKSATFPLITPTRISNLSCFLANSDTILIGSSNSLPNRIAFGPSKNSSKLRFNSSAALLSNVFFYKPLLLNQRF